jgi:transposase
MYPRDLTSKQWFKLEPLLNESRGKRYAGGRPRKHAQRRVVDALLYGVKTGCQWRQLPSNFPPWKTVHEHFHVWRDSGIWERIVQQLREQGRKAGGRNATPTVAIIDAQSAKSAPRRGRRGYDAGKKNQRTQAAHRSRHTGQSADGDRASGRHTGPCGHPRRVDALVLPLRIDHHRLRRWRLHRQAVRPGKR